jgi:hypothetical protein
MLRGTLVFVALFCFTIGYQKYQFLRQSQLALPRSYSINSGVSRLDKSWMLDILTNHLNVETPEVRFLAIYIIDASECSGVLNEMFYYVCTLDNIEPLKQLILLAGDDPILLEHLSIALELPVPFVTLSHEDIPGVLGLYDKDRRLRQIAVIELSSMSVIYRILLSSTPLHQSLRDELARDLMYRLARSVGESAKPTEIRYLLR